MTYRVKFRDLAARDLLVKADVVTTEDARFFTFSEGATGRYVASVNRDEVLAIIREGESAAAVRERAAS